MPKGIRRQTGRPFCKFCGLPAKDSGHKRKDGSNCWKNVCSSCNEKQYKKYKKNKCEFCGFIPLHACQLDVDHKDGNHKNDNIDNLQTLCANCHRLKTYLNRENYNK